MDYGVKFHMKFSSKFWEDNTLGIIVKGKVNLCWDASSYRNMNEKNEEHIISCLIVGNVAEKWEE